MTEPLLHPTAIIDASAELASDVTVGAYSIIGAKVKIDSGCQIGPHVVINGPTSLGKNNRIYQFASLGEGPQDKKFKGEDTGLEIGNNNTIREYCGIERGTVQDRAMTTLGDNNLIMGNCYIGHDCILKDNIIMVNYAALAGHITVNIGATLGGYSAVHQFCEIGAYSFTGLHSVIVKDVPAFVMADGHPASARGMNIEGMRRRGYSNELINILRRAYKTVFRSGSLLEKAIAELEQEFDHSPELALFINSLKSSERGITR